MDNRQREMIHTLMNQHSKPMVQAAYRRIGDWHLAEDLVQETFLTACWKANQICSHTNPTAWLYKTLNNLIMRELHRSYHKEVRFLYKGIIIKHNKTEPTYTKTSLFLCEKRRFFMGRTEKGGKVF